MLWPTQSWRGWISIFVLFRCLLAYPSHQIILQSPVNLTAAEKPWDAVPSQNATGNLIFQSITSLLQHWPNTKYRNGHTIIAANILPGTVLYHGTRLPSFAFDRPEWLATDPEHAFLFCLDVCQLLTFVATRTLRLAYFDGTSAGKLPSGTMDSQDILIWGKVQPDKWLDEMNRITDACEWGKQYGLDGYVRMQMDFEIMICDVWSGMQLVSNSSLVTHEMMIRPDIRQILSNASLLYHLQSNNDAHHSQTPPCPPPPDPVIPDGWRGSLLSNLSAVLESLVSGSWHNQVPGEMRVTVDYSRLVSFFDPALSSLVVARMNKTRKSYRIAGISPDDAQDVRNQLVDIFTRNGTGSGIDWGSVANIVVKRYSGRLKLTQRLLKPSESRNTIEQAAQIRVQVLIMLTPYMITSAIPPNTTDVHNRSWIAPIVNQCASTLTSWASLDNLTRQEKVIKQAIEEVQHEICRVLGEIWLDAFGVEDASIDEARTLLAKWSKDIHGLMQWLDWSTWDECNPACGPEQMCYLPTWPLLQSLPGRRDQEDRSPRCVSLLEPFDFNDHRWFPHV